jgi:hypothetical protein
VQTATLPWPADHPGISAGVGPVPGSENPRNPFFAHVNNYPAPGVPVGAAPVRTLGPVPGITPAFAPWSPRSEFAPLSPLFLGPADATVGLDDALGAVPKVKLGKYRDVDTGDGYVYRQYKTGLIRILKADAAGAHIIGKLYGPAADPTNPDVIANLPAWQAITAQIGTWDVYAARKRDTLLSSGLTAISQVANASIASATKKAKKRRKQAKAAAPAPITLMDDGGSDEGAPFDWGAWAPRIVVGVVVIGALAFAFTRKSDTGDR